MVRFCRCAGIRCVANTDGITIGRNKPRAVIRWKSSRVQSELAREDFRSLFLLRNGSGASWEKAGFTDSSNAGLSLCPRIIRNRSPPPFLRNFLPRRKENHDAKKVQHQDRWRGGTCG